MSRKEVSRRAVSKNPNLTDNKAVINFLVRTIDQPQITPEVFKNLKRNDKVEPNDFIVGPTEKLLLYLYGFDERGVENIQLLTGFFLKPARTPKSLIDWDKVEWLHNKQKNIKQKKNRAKHLRSLLGNNGNNT